MTKTAAQSLLLSLALAAPTPTIAAMATFDTLSEGFYGETLTYGGITFYDVDEHLSIGPGGTLAVDNVSGVIPLVPEWEPFITSPNCLGMTTYVLGPNGLGSRFGELKMTTGSTDSLASVGLFISDWGTPCDYSIVLEAYHVGQIVATDTVSLGLEQSRYEQLTISGVNFDKLRLFANGPDPSRAHFKGAIDNVLIVPEPSTVLLLVLLVGAPIYHRIKKPDSAQL